MTRRMVSVKSRATKSVSFLLTGSAVNDVLTVGSLGLLLFAPPLGAVALTTTTTIGIGLARVYELALAVVVTC